VANIQVHVAGVDTDSALGEEGDTFGQGGQVGRGEAARREDVGRYAQKVLGIGRAADSGVVRRAPKAA
jgi:hypothetical protein